MLTQEEIRNYYAYFSNELEAFVRFFLPHHLTSKVPPFHSEIYKLLPESIRLALASPRGFAKSTQCSVFYPTWASLFNKRRDICIISASEGLAIEWLRKIKLEFETNKQILAFFGDLKSSKWTENHIILADKYKTTLRARGAGGQIRGFRPDLIVCDDLETDETVESEEQRKKLKAWLFKACLNTLLPHGQFIIVGTIIHPLSVLNDILLTDNGWTKRKFQAYKNTIQKPGYELWPALWPHEKLQNRKKEIGSWAFASEYLNDPIADETAPIKEGMIRTWKELPQQLNTVIAVDPAYSEEESADFKVAVHVGIDPKYNRYLLSYIRTHSKSGEFIDAILDLYLQNRGTCTAVGLPSGGGDTEFFNSFLKRAQERGIGVPVHELKNVFTTATGQKKREKKRRVIAALQPWFESGQYFIALYHLEARDELLTIGSSRWDDITDGMAYAEQILTPGAQGLPETPKSPWEEQAKPQVLDYGYEI